MKGWIRRLVSQFNFDWDENTPTGEPAVAINEDRATLLYVMDVYNKHLLELEGRPVRKTREILDEFAREMLNPEQPNVDKVLFRFRNFFGSYRVAEYTYLVRTLEEFRSIIWDFVDQLSEDLSHEQNADRELYQSLEALKDAVESNSIEQLKSQSRRFIDCYVEHQTRKDSRRNRRMTAIKKNLDSVRKQLFEANQNLRLDHLTNAYNRKSFDEQISQYIRLNNVSPQPVTLMMLDIDYFKRINDTFGHAVGDFVLKECVKTLHDLFNRSQDFVARVGGEEFAVILPGFTIESAVTKAEQLLARVRKDVFIHEGFELRFTMSMGIAQLQPKETADAWIKRADEALYSSKHNGRNRYTVSVPQGDMGRAA